MTAQAYEWDQLGDQLMDSRSLIAVAEEIEAMDEEERDDDEREILKAIRELQDEASSEWTYGETLIREDYFEEYAEQLAEDIGAIDREAGWPLGYIDWKAAAEALKIDYSVVEYRGTTYYVRS
jgi:hypothetical protein